MANADQGVVVADYLKGCSSNSSKDSQYPVEARLETGPISSELAASGKILGVGQNGASPATPSSSSHRPNAKHTALAELCCGPKSLIGKEATRKGLEVLRVTKESHDLTTDAGRAAVHRDIEAMTNKHKVHLWASLPCRPWSQLAKMNGRKLGRKFRQYLSELRDESMVLLGVFVDLARHIISSGGSVSFEWPAYCAGWQIPGLQEFFL